MTMVYPEAKVYSDGSHYIAIPHTERPHKPRRKVVEEIVDIIEPEKTTTPEWCKDTGSNEPLKNNEKPSQEDIKKDKIDEIKAILEPTTGKKATKKQLFEKFYRESQPMPKKSRKKYIVNQMKPYFPNKAETTAYVDVNLQRMVRNRIARQIRLWRKINLQNFNYFCTFTYDGNKMDEMTFQKKLRDILRNFSTRKEWRYIGVWERSPEKNRLHFHGIFNIPDGTMPGEIEKISIYDTNDHKRKTARQNTFFLEKLGRNTFDDIDTETDLAQSVRYFLKYMEKTGEKLVYSRGLPQYFISDIMEEDVVCRMGLDDKKLLLFDSFNLWDDGEYIGPVSSETIKKMRKASS